MQPRFQLKLADDGRRDAFRWTHLDTDDPKVVSRWLAAELGDGGDLPCVGTERFGHAFLRDYGDRLDLVAYEFEVGGETIPRILCRPFCVRSESGQVVSWGKDARFVDDVFQKARRHSEWVRTPAMLLFALLDSLVDGFFPFLDRLNDKIYGLERRVLAARSGHSLEGEVVAHKRVVLEARRHLSSTRDLIHALAGRFPEPYHFELYDHMLRVLDIVDGYREMLDTIMDLHLTTVSNRLNEIVKTLTLVTTMMLPASLVASIYGMNFDHAPAVHWRWGFYCVLGFVLAVSAALWLWFRRHRWL